MSREQEVCVFYVVSAGMVHCYNSMLMLHLVCSMQDDLIRQFREQLRSAGILSPNTGAPLSASVCHMPHRRMLGP